jgi:squalene-associated FAD-dependent desaturase
MTQGKVVVIGGGLAGVTAALRCADKGFDVTLLEARPRLGGATSSFQRGDLAVDTGQHVVLRCYSAYLDLLRRLDVVEGVEIQPRFQVPVLSPGGRRSVLRRWALPAPAHLAPALIGYHALTVAQRVEAGRTAMALRRLDPADPALDAVSLGHWLDARGVSARTVEVLWGLLVVATLNAPPHEASLALAAKVFRTGMLDSTDGGDIGIPRRPLGELHGVAAQRALAALGADVRLRTKVRAVRRAGAGFEVVTGTAAEQSTVESDAVVVAVPHQAAADVLAELPVAGMSEWSRLSAAPIVNVHAVFDRPVMDVPMAAVVDSPLQWVFDRTNVAGAPPGSQYLAVSLSAAEDYVRARAEDMRARFLPRLREVFPGTAQANLVDFFVTREPRATFRQAPGTRAIRPSARTEVPGLVLAGAWTGTGWPDTIEGAVRSGERAAEVVNLASGDRKSGAEVTP